MNHDIETASPCSVSERQALQGVTQLHTGATVVAPRADQQKHWRIQFEGNGAELRDLVDDLDRAGFLD